jgi:hypothetical protein
VCDLEISTTTRSGPELGCCAKEKENSTGLLVTIEKQRHIEHFQSY